MAKYTCVLLVVFVSTSLAVGNYYQPGQQQVAGSLHEADLESDFETWLLQRGQAENARAVDTQLAQVRQLSEANQKILSVMPEASNYDVVAEPFWCFCCCIFCSCTGRRRRDLPNLKIRQTGDSEDIIPEITVLGSETEMKLYSNEADLLALYKGQVARAELVSRPLDPATPAQVSDALGGLQHAVVATLTDGRRFLVVKGNRWGQGSQTIVILADHMTDDWTRVTTKDVSQSTLGDFIKAGGREYDALADNGRHAALRMMAMS